MNCEKYVIKESSYAWVHEGEEMKMANIFPDELGIPGSYPTPVEVIQPTAQELADPAAKDVALYWFKSSSDNRTKQELYILSEKAIIMSMLKDSLTETTKDTLRQSLNGRELLLSRNRPLEFINLLMSTDFSKDGVFSIDPLERYHKALSKYSDREFKQYNNESLHDWQKRFNSEIVKLENLAAEAGVVDELPGTAVRALQFFDKLNSNFNELRRRYDTGLRTVKPTTVEDVIEEAKYFDKPTHRVTNITERQHTPATQSRGVYQVTSQRHSGNKHGKKQSNQGHQPSTKKPRLRCLRHNTNDHVYGTPECMRYLGVPMKEMAIGDTSTKNRSAGVALGGRGTAKQS